MRTQSADASVEGVKEAQGELISHIRFWKLVGHSHVQGVPQGIHLVHFAEKVEMAPCSLSGGKRVCGMKGVAPRGFGVHRLCIVEPPTKI